MPSLIHYVCQRCGDRTEIRAALRPAAIQACPKCEGYRQAVRLVTGREARRRVLGRVQGRAPWGISTAGTGGD